jgi:hypothetical protein
MLKHLKSDQTKIRYWKVLHHLNFNKLGSISEAVQNTQRQYLFAIFCG